MGKNSMLYIPVLTIRCDEVPPSEVNCAAGGSTATLDMVDGLGRGYRSSGERIRMGGWAAD